ncbi:MAG TPA: hypothetical protein VFR18_06555 [Terriglobia bacterium]|nr:hypothetical protein [Terriglobia bacterium]
MQLYLADMKNELGLTDEQFLKAGPVIQQFIQMRFRNANQRKALGERQDRLLNEPNASQDDIKQLNNELTALDGQTESWDARFRRRLQAELVGRELSERQILMLRDFNRRFFNEKLPLLVEQIRSENLIKGQGQQQRPAGARANQNRKGEAQPNGPANTLRGNNKPAVQPRQKSTR